MPESVTRITRTLPGEGTFQVVPGEKVASGDVIAESSIPLGFHSLNLAQALGVSKGSADKYLQKKAGGHIFRGELLAQRSGILGKKDVLSPTDGLIGDYSHQTGILKLMYPPKKISVTSGVYGVVETIDASKRKAVIRTMARIIWGIVGVGRDRGGTLEVIGGLGDLTNQQKINSTMTGKILVVGALAIDNAYTQAALFRVAGIVSGGINLDSYKAMAGNYDITKEAVLEPEITVLATEGFGTWPIGEDIYSALQDHHGRFAFIDGKKDRILLPSNDPDSIMTVEHSQLPPKFQPEAVRGEIDLVEGLRVRIIWPPFAGYVGKIIAIDGQLTTLESGISTRLALVETRNRKIKVPFNNLEAI